MASDQNIQPISGEKEMVAYSVIKILIKGLISGHSTTRNALLQPTCDYCRFPSISQSDSNEPPRAEHLGLLYELKRLYPRNGLSMESLNVQESEKNANDDGVHGLQGYLKHFNPKQSSI